MFDNSGSLQKSGDIEVMQLLYILQKELRHRSLVWKYIFMNTNIKFLSRWFFSPYFGLESYISLASVKSPPPPPATEQAPKIDDAQKEFILGIPSWLLWTYVGAHQNLLPPICRSNFHNILKKNFLSPKVSPQWALLQCESEGRWRCALLTFWLRPALAPHSWIDCAIFQRRLAIACSTCHFWLGNGWSPWRLILTSA